ncbi:MAG: aminodeoxychorismate/anthranilate synthase component II [Lentisphaerae bacterium]|nr:aminodeoxychorismate/anthranilate synthase component II [Lentisphaerota bacterium]
MIVLIDNYDSFSYNLVQALAGQGADVRVFRNDETTVDAVEKLAPEGVVISPGPCTPKEAGISVDIIRRLSGRIPILGVCLGHQCIGAAFGGRVANAGRIMHGKTSMVAHDDTPLYKGIRKPFPAGRYHSLAVLAEDLPPDLVVDARSEDGEIMGLHHRAHPTYGVQFHPESVLTPGGKRLLRNFLEIVRVHGEGRKTGTGNTQTEPEA